MQHDLLRRGVSKKHAVNFKKIRSQHNMQFVAFFQYLWVCSSTRERLANCAQIDIDHIIRDIGRHVPCLYVLQIRPTIGDLEKLLQTASASNDTSAACRYIYIHVCAYKIIYNTTKIVVTVVASIDCSVVTTTKIPSTAGVRVYEGKRWMVRIIWKYDSQTHKRKAFFVPETELPPLCFRFLLLYNHTRI